MRPAPKPWKSLLLLGLIIIWSGGCAAVGKPLATGEALDNSSLFSFEDNEIVVTIDENSATITNALSFSIKGLPVVLYLRGSRTAAGWEGQICATLVFIKEPLCVEAGQENVRFTLFNNAHVDSASADVH